MGGKEIMNASGMSGFQETNLKYILVILLVVLVLTFLALSMASNRAYEEMPVCGDGTFYNTCSLDKPYYCDEGVLVERASVCGCPDLGNFSFKREGDFCFLPYYTGMKDVSLDYFLDGQENQILFTVYEGVNDYVSKLSRTLPLNGENVPSRADFKLKSIDDKVQREAILPLIKRIQNLAPDDKVNQARIAVSLVQNIPYEISEKNVFVVETKLNYSRYPYEVLYEGKGVCSGKSQFLVLLLRDLGYGTAIFFFPEENHEAVGIKCPVKESFYGSGYCFVETGGPSIITDYSMEFTDGITLDSEPEILIVSGGISLQENLREYKDAKTLKAIRKRTFLGILNSWKLGRINRRYNLLNVYNLDGLSNIKNDLNNETA
jgi:hypothetical protein